MNEERRNLLMRKEIIDAYITVLERPEELVRVCQSVAGGAEEARAAVAAFFDLSEIAADAVLQLQVRRFTPHAIEQLRNQVADDERRLREIDEA